MKLRTLLLGLSALFIAAAAAYFSVTGLSKLFAGASMAVILMASSLEFGKLISASFLYVYWDKINKILRTYLMIGVCVLILITSAGIYGFLTSAYQSTADQLGIIDKQTMVIKLKKQRFEEQLAEYQKEKSTLAQSISELSKGLSNNVITYKDKDGNMITTTSSANRKAFEKQLDQSKIRQETVISKIEALTDSVSALDVKIIEAETGNDLAAEVGPLKYMSEITGKPMSTIVNWFALLIIFVFDPLAVTLVIAFNTALRIDKQKEEEENIVPSPIKKSYRVYGESIKSEPIYTPTTEVEEDVFDSLEDLDPPTATISSEPPIETKEVSTPQIDPELESLTRDMKRRPIDIDGDGSIDGYDTDGDGLIDKYTYAGSIMQKNGKLPYYARPDFDWNDKSKWINDQNAVNYWITHRKF